MYMSTVVEYTSLYCIFLARYVTNLTRLAVLHLINKVVIR